jgi:hypothetical protein
MDDDLPPPPPLPPLPSAPRADDRSNVQVLISSLPPSISSSSSSSSLVSTLTANSAPAWFESALSSVYEDTEPPISFDLYTRRSSSSSSSSASSSFSSSSFSSDSSEFSHKRRRGLTATLFDDFSDMRSPLEIKQLTQSIIQYVPPPSTYIDRLPRKSKDFADLVQIPNGNCQALVIFGFPFFRAFLFLLQISLLFPPVFFLSPQLSGSLDWSFADEK